MYDDKYPIKLVSEHPIYGQALAEFKKIDNKPVTLVNFDTKRIKRVLTRAAVFDLVTTFKVYREDHEVNGWFEVFVLTPEMAKFKRVGE